MAIREAELTGMQIFSFVLTGFCRSRKTGVMLIVRSAHYPAEVIEENPGITLELDHMLGGLIFHLFQRARAFDLIQRLRISRHFAPFADGGFLQFDMKLCAPGMGSNPHGLPGTFW